MTYRKFRIPTVLWFGGNCLLFMAMAVMRQIQDPFVGNVFTGASICAVLASICFGMMLFIPEKKWLRILVVVFPPLVLGLRMLALWLDQPVYWLGFFLAMGYGYALALAGPLMMPPAMSNGCVKSVLGGDRG
jgi:hypothetical protein